MKIRTNFIQQDYVSPISSSCLLGMVMMIASFPQFANASAIWGSFDGSRINYEAGDLTTGSVHDTLRNIIAESGNTLAPAASILTSDYLGNVDIFYTSLISNSTGILSLEEQVALQSWVAGGGTLIVTADYKPLAGYESFTSAFGVTDYTSIKLTGNGTVEATHPITMGVTSFFYAADVTFSKDANGLTLGKNQNGDTFMTVMEPSTGFNLGGRVLVLGDHNLFTDNYIGQQDNELLATNMVQWAMIPEPTTITLLLLALAATPIRRRP